MGIERATGEWIAFVDADDRIEPNHLQLLIDATRTGEPEIVIGGYTEHWPEKALKEQYLICEEECMASKRQLMETTKHYSTYVVWDKLIAASIIRDNGFRFNIRYKNHEDAIFVRQCLLVAQRVKTIPTCSYHYMHINESSAIAVYDEMRPEAWALRQEYGLRLMAQAGYPEEEIEAARIQDAIGLVYGTINNLFHPGCPLSFREKICEVRRKFFDDADMLAVMASADKKSLTKFQCVILRLYSLRSPFAMFMVFRLRYIIHTLLPQPVITRSRK